jgi:hypothetical protein
MMSERMKRFSVMPGKPLPDGGDVPADEPEDEPEDAPAPKS